MAESSYNPWKFVTIGILLVVVTAGVTALVVSKWGSSEAPRATPAQSGKGSGAGGAASRAGGASPVSQPAAAPVAQPAGTVPPQAVINDCNRYASAPPSDRDKLLEVAKDAAIGGVGTAAVGAAAGAIAAGGSGAGKGAAIGGIVGAVGGALYGINENRKTDEAYRNAYAHCMRVRGYAS